MVPPLHREAPAIAPITQSSRLRQVPPVNRRRQPHEGCLSVRGSGLRTGTDLLQLRPSPLDQIDPTVLLVDDILVLADMCCQ